MTIMLPTTRTMQTLDSSGLLLLLLGQRRIDDKRAKQLAARIKTKQAAAANAFCEWPLFVSPFLSQKQSSSQIFSLDRSVVILRPSNAKTARYSRRCLQWLYVLYL